MRRTFLAAAVTLLLAAVCRADTWTEDYSQLLGKYVTPSGVKYADWHNNAADLATLKKVVGAIAQEKPAGGRDEKLAFYINAYNANILEGVMEKYPIQSVRDIALLFGFFTQNRITVAGEKMSFNHLEKDIIHGLGEPRMHFVLNCASASCPPLLNKAYTPGKLDGEMDVQTTAFLNGNPKGVSVSNGGHDAAVSKIFDWNAGDFQGTDGVPGFINRYRKPPLPKDVKITYQDYDWSLNAAN